MPDDWLVLPHFRQERVYTCTPACVRMEIAYFGLCVPEPELILLRDSAPDFIAVAHFDTA